MVFITVRCSIEKQHFEYQYQQHAKQSLSVDLLQIFILHLFGFSNNLLWKTLKSKIRCGVALDAWMFPLDDEVFPRVKQPIFFINSEKFQWAGNIIRMRKLDSAVIQRKMITIRYNVKQLLSRAEFKTCRF